MKGRKVTRFPKVGDSVQNMAETKAVNKKPKISDENSINRVLAWLQPLDNGLFYDNAEMFFDVLEGCPVLSFKLYALIKPGRSLKTKLSCVQWTVWLSANYRAIKKFINEENGFDIEQFDIWVKENLDGVIKTVVNHNNAKMFISTREPWDILWWKTPEEANKSLVEFKNVKLFDLYSSKEKKSAKEYLATRFEHKEEIELKDWVNGNSAYDQMSSEVFDRFISKRNSGVSV